MFTLVIALVLPASTIIASIVLVLDRRLHTPVSEPVLVPVPVYVKRFVR